MLLWVHVHLDTEWRRFQIDGWVGAGGTVVKNFRLCFWLRAYLLSGYTDGQTGSLTWTCFLRSEHSSQCSVTTLSAYLQIVAPLEAEKQRSECLTLQSSTKDKKRRKKKQKPYFKELVDLAQVDPFFGIQFVDITHVPIHQVQTKAHHLNHFEKRFVFRTLSQLGLRLF